jgi:hypothetical protein
MTPDDLATAGRALYGERWQTALAHDLHVSDRTMRRWLAGDSAISEHVERDLRAVLVARHGAIDGMIAPEVIPAGRTIHQNFPLAEGAADAFRELQEHVAHAEPAWLAAPVDRRSRAAGLHGFMRGSVIIPPEIDLTAPVVDETFAVEKGEIP